MKKRIKFDLKGFLNKKENMALIAMAVILCAGVAVTNVKANNIPLHDGDVLVDSQNVAQADETDETTDATADEETTGSSETVAGVNASLEEQRAKLDLQRNDLIAGYEDTIKNSTNEAEQKSAVAKKEKLTGYMEQEIAIEGIITSKNLPTSLVIITDNTVTVTVDEQDLKQDVVAKICNIVMEETGRTADKIIIQSAY